MTETYSTETLRNDDPETPVSRRHPQINRNQPYLTSIDLMLGLVICVMIWGPLAVGAFASK